MLTTEGRLRINDMCAGVDMVSKCSGITTPVSSTNFLAVFQTSLRTPGGYDEVLRER